MPALPVLEVKTSLPPGASFSSFHDYENVVTSASVTLHQGESTECTVILTNVSQVDVETIDITMQTVLDSNLQEQMFTWSEQNLRSQLPLKPGCSASFTLYIYAVGRFLAATGAQVNFFDTFLLLRNSRFGYLAQEEEEEEVGGA